MTLMDGYKRANEALQAIAEQDALTKLYNKASRRRPVEE